MDTTLRFPAGITHTNFLRDYWQRRPLLMRQALTGFDCQLQADELAGLACAADVESRLVLEKDGASPWEARQGPFSNGDFAQLPENHWTLLVQDVDKHWPAVAGLLEPFRFLPDWRLDDVMVSYAVDQGSVGPHTDDYDVFLYQAQGRRRWKIHHRTVTETDLIPGLDLCILREFEADEEWLLEPGDLLYLPPNLAHWGIAEGECMTCSIGFRAPSYRELLTAWCDDLIDRHAPAGRYRDADLVPQSASAEILPEVISKISELFQGTLRGDGDDLRRWFGRFISDSKQNLQVTPPDNPMDTVEFINRYRQLGVLQRSHYSRMAFSRGAQGSDSLFANGVEYLLPSDEGDFLPVITHYRVLHFGYLQSWLQQPDYLQLVCELYNAGHFQF